MSNIGHNSGEVTIKNKLEKHYKAMKATMQTIADLRGQLKDLKASAKADGVDAAVLAKLITQELGGEEKAAKAAEKQIKLAEYAHLLQLNFDF